MDALLPRPFLFTSSRFDRAYAALGLLPGTHAFADLAALHGQASRHYHGQLHVSHCLVLLDENRSLARRPAEIELALWYHDSIYDARGSDNEERSAALADRDLESSGLEVSSRDRIKGMILATRHGQIPSDRDKCLMVDLDLSILGAPSAVFREYDLAIREEYAWVPSEAYRTGRRAVLEGFLHRERIYQTPELRDRFEVNARANLAAALAGLGGVPTDPA